MAAQLSNVHIPYQTMWPKQVEFMHRGGRVDLDIVCYQGGYGSGKTWGGSLLGILLALKYPGSRGLVTADSFTLLKDTTIISYLEHFENFGFVEGVHYRLVGGAGNGSATITFFNGSHILFKGGRDPEKLKSLNLDWCHAEEGSQLTEGAYNMIISRLRGKNIDCHRFFLTTNPQANKGWIYKHFVERGGLTTDVIDGRLVRIHKRRIIAPTTDNKALGGAYIANLKDTYDDDYYKINVLGLDGDYNSGLVASKWSDANIDDVRCQYRSDLPLYITCDFNVDPMCWGIAHYLNYELRFIDELATGPITTEAAAREIGRKYQGHEGGIILTGDASGQSRRVEQQDLDLTNYKIIQDVLMRDYGIPGVDIQVEASNPLIDARVASYNGACCSHSGVRRVFANSGCKYILYNMENLKYIEGTSEFDLPGARSKKMELDKSLKYLGHMYDAVTYLVHKIMPVSDQRNFYTRTEFETVRYQVQAHHNKPGRPLGL